MGKSKKLSLPKKGSLLIPPEKVIDTTNRAFTVSFAQLDHKNQGATIDTIQDAKELSHMIEMFHGFKNEPVHKLVSSLGSDKFCIYGGFPPKDKTEFTHPKHVPHDAEWARIHITGKFCAIGHIFQGVFYLVYLDTEHKFWKSELKHT